MWLRLLAQDTALLLAAAKQGNALVMRALIDAKADQTAELRDRRTAIELLLGAVAGRAGSRRGPDGTRDLCAAIEASGADVNLRSSVRGRIDVVGALMRRCQAHVTQMSTYEALCVEFGGRQRQLESKGRSASTGISSFRGMGQHLGW